jgi:16S rRNA (guanine527-N7)-methyltransferase
VSFAEQLAVLLPEDLPNRETVIAKSARHLDLIVEANRSFNLTRILNEREAAIKHVLDSVIPWQWFSTAREVCDGGTGAGFPGIPLALVLPDVRFVLVESTGKKARFVESVARELELDNVLVTPRRVEDYIRGRNDLIITARAVAPMTKMADLIGPAIRVGSRALLYKGPEVDDEIQKAESGMKRYSMHAQVLQRYSLPDDSGERTFVELARKTPPVMKPSGLASTRSSR